MTNPYMRGSAPGRAQSAHQRSGSFKHHEKLGGRKRGSPNVFSIDYKKAILEAAYRVGYDGNGENGIVGYFSWVAEHHPRIYGAVLLINLLPLEYAESDTPEEPRLSTEEINREVRDYIGLTGKNPTGPVGSLMHLAVESPKAFCTLCAAAFLRPPTKRCGRATRRLNRNEREG